jgi:hypothetical protein
MARKAKGASCPAAAHQGGERWVIVAQLQRTKDESVQKVSSVFQIQINDKMHSPPGRAWQRIGP